MDWTDAAVKIGVGACLGFGIIVLAKLGRKKNDHDHKAARSSSAVQQDTTGRTDTECND
jgi:hypothetical protein